MKKLTILSLISLISASAIAMDWTGRVELRDSMTASSTCGTSANCTANSTMGFGVGATTPVWVYDTSWALVTGGLIRQRVSSISVSGTTASGTYLDLDIPVAAQWSNASFAARLGLDLAFKLSSSYSSINSSAVSDNALVLPVEIAFDWKFLPNQLVGVSYEFGTVLANGQNGAAGLATSGVLSVSYGYLF